MGRQHDQGAMRVSGCDEGRHTSPQRSGPLSRLCPGGSKTKNCGAMCDSSLPTQTAVTPHTQSWSLSKKGFLHELHLFDDN